MAGDPRTQLPELDRAYKYGFVTEIDEDRGWAEKLYDQALRLYPAGRERCAKPFCRRISFMYGEVYDHDQLNDATHEALHEAFGNACLEAMAAGR